MSDKKDWDLYLPFVLFAYRHTPTGYSPFQLIYGFNVRGPLEVLCDSWIDGDVLSVLLLIGFSKSKLISWIFLSLLVITLP